MIELSQSISPTKNPFKIYFQKKKPFFSVVIINVEQDNTERHILIANSHLSFYKLFRILSRKTNRSLHSSVLSLTVNSQSIPYFQKALKSFTESINAKSLTLHLRPLSNVLNAFKSATFLPSASTNQFAPNVPVYTTPANAQPQT